MNLMTEIEWARCEDPARMIFEFGLCSDHRKARLLLTSHCRRGWDHLSSSSRRAVKLAEQFVEGIGTAEELARVREETREEVSYIGVALDHHDPREIEYDPATQSTFVRDLTEQEFQQRQRLRLCLGATAFADAAVWAEYRKIEPFFWDLLPDERRRDADNVRDIFGNPFRPVTFSPSWRTDTAVSLAEQMYDSREFSAMPILADALQDAGCDNNDVLSHCRGSAPVHVRGCWVVDLVLGKAV